MKAKRTRYPKRRKGVKKTQGRKKKRQRGSGAAGNIMMGIPLFAALATAMAIRGQKRP